MAKLFRKIKSDFLADSNAAKYFKYAIGEILLVVIGILIALQINNCNESNKLRNRELALLNELHANLVVNVTNLDSDIEAQTMGMISFDYILDLPNNYQPYNDSIPEYLSVIDFTPDVILVSSAFQTLRSSGLELIQSDSLRIEIVNLFEVDYPKLMQETRRLEDQLWPAVVVPLFQRHFRNERGIWIPNDYDSWLDDTEFFNMVSFRENLRYNSTNYKKTAMRQTISVINLIERELKKRR